MSKQEKQELLRAVRQARQTFMDSLDGLAEDEMLHPGVVGIWSVKDIMAHLIAWEAELITALSRKLSPRYNNAPAVIKIEDVDDWNMEQYHLNASRPLEVILPDFHGVHKHLLLAIEDLDANILSDPLRFEWMEGEPLSYLVLDIAVYHEEEHADSIRDWRSQRPQS